MSQINERKKQLLIGSFVYSQQAKHKTKNKLSLNPFYKNNWQL